MSASMSTAPALLTRSSSFILSPPRLEPTRLSTKSPFFFFFFFSPTRRSLSTTIRASSASPQPLELCVKESLTAPGKLSDCPFCQRVLLTLEEKHLPYDMKLIDLSSKPDWFLKITPESKVPVAKLDEKWVADSDVVTQSVEEKYPDPPLATPPGKATIEESGYIRKIVGVMALFINEDRISAANLSLAPKLYHTEIALGHYKNWSVPESLSYVKSYMKSVFSNDSFMKTKALPEDVIAGWRPKVFA